MHVFLLCSSIGRCSTKMPVMIAHEGQTWSRQKSALSRPRQGKVKGKKVKGKFLPLPYLLRMRYLYSQGKKKSFTFTFKVITL